MLQDERSGAAGAKEVSMRPWIGVALSTCVLGAVAMAQSAPPASVPVGTVQAARKPVTRQPDFVGRVEAVDRVEVRARVKGFLEGVVFKEGDLVKEGDELYRIEKESFEAAVQQAEGAVERSKAALALAKLNLERAEELLTRSSGTVVARDQAQAQLDTAKGSLLTDEANLATAKINLGYTTIRTPITGKISRTNVTKGNVVGPDSGILTTVVSQDPMHLTFPVSQRDFLRVRQTGRQLGEDDYKNLKVRARFSDGSLYDEVGTVNFVDVSVDRSTDTILARASMPNPKGALVDNQLVRVMVEIGTPDEKVVVPQSSLIADQEGTYVFVVEAGKAAVKRVKVGAESGADVVVEQGLSGGEQVIAEGLQGVRPGAAVLATPLKRLGEN
jgi:membrane fusion protein (multidrug efflux system)